MTAPHDPLTGSPPPEGEQISALIDTPQTDLRGSYVHLLKLTLTGIFSAQPFSGTFSRELLLPVPVTPNDIAGRVDGRDWPLDAFTMIGMKRLNNVQACVEDVIDNQIPGDLIETGVWRGGTTIFMRALLKLNGITDRLVFAADSFRGLPPSHPERSPAGEGSNFHRLGYLHMPVEQVRENFRRFGVLDDQVRLVEGSLQDTLPTLAERTWSVVRLDGDTYESTIAGLENLYPMLSPGGHLIVDDYGSADACRRAVDDYRETHRIEEEIRTIDWTGVYWQKAG